MLRRIRNMRRQPPEFEQLRLQQLPGVFLQALLLRGLFDAHFDKQGQSESAWSRTRAERSYERLLEAHGVPTAMLHEQQSVR